MGHLDSSLARQVRVEEELLLQFEGLVATVGLPSVPSSWGLGKKKIKPEVMAHKKVPHTNCQYSQIPF